MLYQLSYVSEIECLSLTDGREQSPDIEVHSTGTL
jgi:hypothetical protein